MYSKEYVICFDTDFRILNDSIYVNKIFDYMTFYVIKVQHDIRFYELIVSKTM